MNRVIGKFNDLLFDKYRPRQCLSGHVLHSRRMRELKIEEIAKLITLEKYLHPGILAYTLDTIILCKRNEQNN